MKNDEGRLRFLRRGTERPRHRFRRGVYLLPSLFTMGNMFCGYACVVYAMNKEYETAAPFIGFAYVLDMLDGRIARLTGAESAFGLQFDSLALTEQVRTLAKSRLIRRRGSLSPTALDAIERALKIALDLPI